MGHFHAKASVDLITPALRVGNIRTSLRLSRRTMAEYGQVRYNAYCAYEAHTRKMPWHLYFQVISLLIEGACCQEEATMLVNFMTQPVQDSCEVKTTAGPMTMVRIDRMSQAVSQLVSSMKPTGQVGWFLREGNLVELLLYIRQEVLCMSRGQLIRCSSITEALIKKPENGTAAPTLAYALGMFYLLAQPVEAIRHLLSVQSKEEYEEQFLPTLRASNAIRLLQVRDRQQSHQNRSIARSASLAKMREARAAS